MLKISLMCCLLFFSSAVMANNLPCGSTNPAEYLENDHSEYPYSIAISNRGFLVTTYVNSDSGTWTIVVQPPDKKLFCFLDGGTGWHKMDISKKK